MEYFIILFLIIIKYKVLTITTDVFSHNISIIFLFKINTAAVLTFLVIFIKINWFKCSHTSILQHSQIQKIKTCK